MDWVAGRHLEAPTTYRRRPNQLSQSRAVVSSAEPKRSIGGNAGRLAARSESSAIRQSTMAISLASIKYLPQRWRGGPSVLMRQYPPLMRQGGRGLERPWPDFAHKSLIGLPFGRARSSDPRSHADRTAEASRTREKDHRSRHPSTKQFLSDAVIIFSAKLGQLLSIIDIDLPRPRW
jgi:hypothetical protein